MKKLILYLPWLLLLLGMDLVGSLLLWLVDARKASMLSFFLLLFSLFFFGGVCVWLYRLEQKRTRLFRDYLQNPTPEREALLRDALGAPFSEEMDWLSDAFRAREQALSQAKIALRDYRDYVESWAHETKTPLSLLTVLLDNRREELGGPVAGKLDYVRNRIQEFVNQMLYYARLTGGEKDYRFATIPMGELVEEVLEDYRPLLEERGLTVSVQGGEKTVFTDRRGMLFLLSQLISNGVKYSNADSRLEIALTQQGDRQRMTIRDYGRGVRPCDLPYIFEKGFTGTPDPEQRRATGMGLYLARKMAEDLHVELRAVSEWGKGFCMELWFPIVRQEKD